MTVLSEPALDNETYSRAKSCYQNQYVETYHPGTREKPGYVSSREDGRTALPQDPAFPWAHKP